MYFSSRIHTNGTQEKLVFEYGHMLVVQRAIPSMAGLHLSGEIHSCMAGSPTDARQAGIVPRSECV